MSIIAHTGREFTIIPPSSDLGFNIEMAREFARRNSKNPIWRQFKKKWDGHLPRQGSVCYDEFASDAQIVQDSIQTIFNEVMSK